MLRQANRGLSLGMVLHRGVKQCVMNCAKQWLVFFDVARGDSLVSRRLIVTAALALLSTGSVLADTPLVATLANSIEKQQKPVLASIIWRCEGNTCTSASPSQGSLSSACHAIARRFGEVVSFSTAKGEFGQEELAKCNKGVS